MKKALIITYYWPPAGGPGVQRWLKMVKYLPEAGVEPLVLTVDAQHAEYPILDASLEQDSRSDLKIRRTKSSSLYHWYKLFTGASKVPYSGFANEGAPNWKQKISRFIRGNFFLPDLRKGWNSYALAEATAWILEETPEWIITTGPPMSTHLIGQELKRRFPQLKWVADFRDPWTDIYYYHRMYPSALARRWDKKMELAVLQQANAVIGVSPFVTKLLASKLSESVSSVDNTSKFHCITNGFDPEDYTLSKTLAPNEFTMCYTGTMADNYPMDGLIQAITRLQKKHFIELKMVGKVAPVIRARLSESIQHIRFIDFVPHHESVRHIQEASLLLLVLPIDPGARDIIPGKVFEYIGSGTPTLCLGSPDSDSATILRECDAGKTIDSEDSFAIEAYLKEQIIKEKHFRFAANAQHPYSRQSLACRVVDEILCPPNTLEYEL